jgi:CubicO group peptidase (beta-lactamase class C family)
VTVKANPYQRIHVIKRRSQTRDVLRKAAVAAALSIAIATTAAASEPKEAPDAIALAELDGFALGLQEAAQFSGVVLVARDGRVVFEKAYGKLDEKADAPVTTRTRFNLASVGKMFTSTAILQQAAAGRLSLERWSATHAKK